ncbi:MAG: hypothetical protein J5I65_05710 [Aridibacter famidurans]|nr:hypothetical protein [Aridibacter famidurans]
MAFANFIDWRPDGTPFGLYYSSGQVSGPKMLGELIVGSKLLYRSKTDWREAVVSRRTASKAMLTVCSPKGYTYRLSRSLWSEIVLSGNIPVLRSVESEDWRENLATYDQRW